MFCSFAFSAGQQKKALPNTDRATSPLLQHVHRAAYRISWSSMQPIHYTLLRTLSSSCCILTNAGLAASTTLVLFEARRHARHQRCIRSAHSSCSSSKNPWPLSLAVSLPSKPRALKMGEDSRRRMFEALSGLPVSPCSCSWCCCCPCDGVVSVACREVYGINSRTAA